MHRFRQVDVFSSEPLRGNPVAVVHDADDLTAGWRRGRVYVESVGGDIWIGGATGTTISGSVALAEVCDYSDATVPGTGEMP